MGAKSIMNNKPWVKHYDPEVPEELKYPLIPAHQILKNTSNLCPNFTAITEPGQGSVTFRELYNEAKQVANGLIELGLQKGDRVALILPNSRSFASSFWGILMSGGIAVPLNPLYTETEINRILSQTSPKITISLNPDKKYAELSMFVRPEALQNVSIIELDIDINPSRDLAFIQYTGGTTGEPKGCMFTHENFVAAIYGQAVWASPTRNYVDRADRRMLMVLPLSHIFGLVYLGFSAKSAQSITLLPRFDFNQVVQILSQGGFTMWPCVPTMLGLILRHPKAQEIIDANPRMTITLGGAPCPQQLRSKIRQYSLNVYEGWAMTETCGRGIAPPLLGRQKKGRLGIPVTGLGVKIVSPFTGGRGASLEGELLVRGPSVMKGYWNNHEENQRVFESGWLHTGDVASMDKDGYISILGRYKECVLHGGYTIYPQEIDNVILSFSPEFIDSITYGEPDETYGENVVSVVRTNQAQNEKELLDYCRQHLAPFKIPSRIIFTSEPLPRTPAGKPLRHWMPKWVREGVVA